MKVRRRFRICQLEPSTVGRSEWVPREVAHGVLYSEGNVQVLWRKDIGWTAEQYANLSQVFGILPGAHTIELEAADV